MAPPTPLLAGQARPLVLRSGTSEAACPTAGGGGGRGRARSSARRVGASGGRLAGSPSPRALIALCEAVRRGDARPYLVVGVPVGFVAVAESKEQALELAVPVISVRGRKGGSAVAAAATNALLLMAAEEGER